MSINSKMTAIADKIRSLLGITGNMGLDAMATNLGIEQTNIESAFTAVGNKGGTVPSSKVSGNLASAIASIPEGATFQKVSGTFTSVNNASGVTLNCGFKPDFVMITEKRTYRDSDTNRTYNLDTAFDFIDGTDDISVSNWADNDIVYDFFVSRQDTGFTARVWKYNSDMSDASWWGGKNFTYYAYKIT